VMEAFPDATLESFSPGESFTSDALEPTKGP